MTRRAADALKPRENHPARAAYPIAPPALRRMEPNENDIERRYKRLVEITEINYSLIGRHPNV